MRSLQPERKDRYFPFNFNHLQDILNLQPASPPLLLEVDCGVRCIRSAPPLSKHSEPGRNLPRTASDWKTQSKGHCEGSRQMRIGIKT